ncbi:MAG: alpha/beta hydrolase [Gemmatimonadota bacterium]|nr:alpha/beta hydrolase [Gemmatimonadota bacterium]
MTTRHAVPEEVSCLFLPGMTLNGTLFPEVPGPSLAVDFRELVVSPNGEFPEGQLDRMDFYVARLDEALNDWSEWRAAKRIIVAHSFGGMLALSWLLKNRGSEVAKIDGLVLCSTTCGPMFDIARLSVARILKRPVTMGLKNFMRFWNLPVVTRTVKRILTRGSLAVRYVDLRDLKRKSDAAVDRAGWRQTDWRAMRSYRLAMDGFDVRNKIADLDVATIVLHGGRDSVFPPSVGEELVRFLPNATLRPIPDAGHALPLTHPDSVLQAVGDLVRRV